MSKLPPGYYLAPSIFYKYPVLYDTFGPCLSLYKLWEAVSRSIDPQPGQVVLDVCSGTGALGLILAQKLDGRGEVVGVDLTPQMVRRARGKVKTHVLHFIRGYAEALPFPDDSFHKTIVSLALHEMPQPARGRVLSEIFRVTKPGGRMVVGEFWPSQKWYIKLFDRVLEEPQWINEMAGLKAEIENSSFRVLSQEILPVGHFQVVIAWKIAPC